jgi:hypothetical protein
MDGQEKLKSRKRKADTLKLLEAKLFADGSGKRVFDLRVSRYRHGPPVCRVRVEIVVGAVPLQITTALSENSQELPPFHIEMAISCFSLGTNALSAASSTIKR